ncbi:hypothetical protein QEM33_005557 [Pseudomonas putida]|nr:hypothetical protein [Pseudomonas putida]
MDAKDMIPVTINKTSSAVQGIAGLGSVIGFFVAPVPTVTGLILLEVVSGAISESSEGKGARALDRIERRRFDRDVALLRKHGTIPQTSVLSTDLVELHISLDQGTITWTILKGEHAGRPAQDLTAEELQAIAESAANQDTADIVKGYMRYRESVQTACPGRRNPALTCSTMRSNPPSALDVPPSDRSNSINAGTPESVQSLQPPAPNVHVSAIVPLQACFQHVRPAGRPSLKGESEHSSRLGAVGGEFWSWGRGDYALA